MYHSPSAGKDSTKAFTIFVQQMNMHGLLKTDDLITRFFRMSTQMCVDLCYRALAEQNSNQTLVRAKCFHTLDAFVRLIALLVKHSGDQQNTITKVEHQEAPCPTECLMECLMEWLVGCRKDQPALDQTLVQQSRKSTRSMLLFNISLLRNFISIIEHKHVIYLPKYFDRNIYIC